MALELAVGIVRVRLDRQQLRAEIAAARAAILKGLSGIKVKVDIDTKGFETRARSAGTRAGKAAGQAFLLAASSAATGTSVGGGGAIMARRGRTRGAFETSPGTFLMPGAGRSRVFPTPPRGFIGGPILGGGGQFGGGGGGGTGTAPRSFFNGPFFGGGGFGGGGRFGGGGGGGGGGRGGMFVPGGRGRFGGMAGLSPMGAFAGGLGFQIAPTLTASAMFGGPAGAAGAVAGMGVMAAGQQAAESVRQFADFEASIGFVKILQRESGATEEQLARLEAQARRLGETTVFSAKAAADAMAVLTKRGFDANQVYQQMPAVLALAAAGEIDVAQAADTVGAVLQQFKLQAKDSGTVADLLAKASISSATDVNQLGIALSYAGATANLSGKDLKETVATLMLLSDSGIAATRAGTGLTRILTGLSDPKKIEFLEAMGIEATRDGAIRPMQELVLETDAAFRSMTALQRVHVAFKAFGQRGGPTFANLIDPDKFKEFMALLDEAEGTAQRVGDERMKLLENRMETLKDATIELRLTLVESFEGEIKTAVDLATESVILLSNALKALKGDSEIAGVNVQAALKSMIGPLPGFALKEFRRVNEGFAAVQGGREKLPLGPNGKLPKDFDKLPPRGGGNGAGAAPGMAPEVVSGGDLGMFGAAGLGMGLGMPGLVERISGKRQGGRAAEEKFRPMFLGLEEFQKQIQTGVLTRKDDKLDKIEKNTKDGADAGKQAVTAIENLDMGGRWT